MSNGTYSWYGIAGTWFWIDPVKDLAFVGMIQHTGPAAADVRSVSAIWCIRLWSIDEREADDEAESIYRHREVRRLRLWCCRRRHKIRRRHRSRQRIRTRTTRRPARPSSRSPRRPAETATPRRRRRLERVNQGPFDPSTWKYGPAFNPPAGAKIWNPVKAKMIAGREGHRRHGLQRHRSGHLLRDGQRRLRLHLDRDAARPARLEARSRACGGRVPTRRRFPASRVAYTDEREIQHALDAGALVVVVPTVDTVEEAIEARNWTYFPPLGRRSNGGGQAFDAHDVGRRARRLPQHDQRQRRADPDDRNARGPEERRRDREGPGRDRGLRGERRPRQFLGYRQGTPDYERAINIVHDAAIKAGTSGCAVRWRGAIDRTSPASRPPARRRFDRTRRGRGARDHWPNTQRKGRMLDRSQLSRDTESGN